ncbi:MAG: lysophospholipid acyltransferase family protein [Candidatus Sericytochromatia bacterium]|nr:lysophospholipid acyltransferase family protein [Candidatus Sericytochromatia bacterium]
MVSLKDARYQVLKNLFGPLVADVACPTEIVGEAHIPVRGPGLLVCNHRSVMDPYLVSARAHRIVNWVMAPFVAAIPVFGWLAREAGAIPILKGEEGKAEALIEEMGQVFRQGRLVGIFPEGMANFVHPIGAREVSTFRPTFIRAVLAARIPHLPIIPAAIYPRREVTLGEVSGAFLQQFDPGERSFQLERMQLLGYQEALIVVGRPLTLDAYYDGYGDQAGHQEPAAQTALIESLAAMVRAHVAQLLDRAALLEAPIGPEALVYPPP